MPRVEEQIAVYNMLVPEERKQVDAYLDAHPEMMPLLAPLLSVPLGGEGRTVTGGGQAANTAAWLAWHGVPVTLVATVGDDDVGALRLEGKARAAAFAPTRFGGPIRDHSVRRRNPRPLANPRPRVSAISALPRYPGTPAEPSGPRRENARHGIGDIVERAALELLLQELVVLEQPLRFGRARLGDRPGLLRFLEPAPFEGGRR